MAILVLCGLPEATETSVGVHSCTARAFRGALRKHGIVGLPGPGGLLPLRHRGIIGSKRFSGEDHFTILSDFCVPHAAGSSTLLQRHRASL